MEGTSTESDFCEMEGTSTEVDSCELEEPISKQDPYIRKAKEQGWRSRSCFKLLQIDEKFGILKGVKRAVDLYASPGIWTQVLSRKLAMGETIYMNDKCCLFYNDLALHQRLEAQEKPDYNKDNEVIIVAVDAYGIPPYSGVVQINGDLAQYSTAELILKQFDGNKADLVVCGKLIDHTGLHCIDVNFQANHMVLVIHITCHVLRNGGTLVAAIFKESDNDFLKSQLSSLFKEVDFFRPKSSKTSANEIFAVCRQYTPPDGFDPKLMEPYLDFCNKDFSPLKGINRIIIPFLLCGDVSAFPLSPEDEKLYVSKFTEPFPQDEPCSSRRSFRKKDLDHYIEKINEAIKSVGLESGPDLSEMEMIKKRSSELGATSKVKDENDQPFHKDNSNEGEQSVYDNGPLFDLIQKTTKIKKYPPETDDTNTATAESELQFLYEDESTDPEMIRECLERVSAKSSTCTCEHFP
ncbi:putative tRNA (cytidine(32)/guanosine(34)-2'-O)-methyltransferase [Anoplophora glabripennis]|nr:putative tRNA (cytidine(32)/guanosine(34)-2'-O)-methyltransferase [Anoplophora glabripennis]